MRSRSRTPSALPSACSTAACWSRSWAGPRASPRNSGSKQKVGAMRLEHSIDFARADRIGANGVTPEALTDALKRTEPALAWLRARHADGGLPLLRFPAKHDDLLSIKDAARRLTATGATDIVILGVGGSSLGGQTLAQLEDYAVPGAGLLRSGPRLHFMDNLDPGTYATLLARLPLATT